MRIVSVSLALAVIHLLSQPSIARAADAPPASAAGAATPAAAGAADDQFDLKIKGLEEQVNDLKEKIFRTKSRLLLLQETVLGGDISSSAKAIVFHQNDMGSQFVLESAAYALDGAPIFTKVDNGGDLADKPSFEIFNGQIVPGNHQISVRLTYRGHGYGLFTYLEGYKFKVQSSYTFNAEPGRVSVVRVVGFEKGGITTELKDRPAIRYDIEVSKEKPSDAAVTPTSVTGGAGTTK
ncbi:MAG: dihydrolipoamide acetyltransferase [Deltaproteobacteria bacterium]